MADVPMSVDQGAAEGELRRRLVETRSSVEGFLKQAQIEQALAEVLKDPPYGGPEESKEMAAQLVLKVLSAFKDSNAKIKKAVGLLGDEEHAALMKYLYKFWESGQPAKTNAQLFIWHAALVELAGQGCIVRAVYDMR